MNGKLNTDTYQYRLNQLHRDDIMRAADQQHLAQIAAEEPKDHHPLMAGLIRRVRSLFSRYPMSEGGNPKLGKTLRHIPSAIHLAKVPKLGAAGARTSQSRTTHHRSRTA